MRKKRSVASEGRTGPVLVPQPGSNARSTATLRDNQADRLPADTILLGWIHTLRDAAESLFAEIKDVSRIRETGISPREPQISHSGRFNKKGNPSMIRIPFVYCDGAEGVTRTPTGFPPYSYIPAPTNKSFVGTRRT